MLDIRFIANYNLKFGLVKYFSNMEEFFRANHIMEKENEKPL